MVIKNILGFILVLTSLVVAAGCSYKSNETPSSQTNSKADFKLEGSWNSEQAIYCDPNDEDIHCYANRCAWHLGENHQNSWQSNYMPQDIDPSTAGVEIIQKIYHKKVRYEKATIRWNNQDLTFWQYTFDGNPGSLNYPQFGFVGPVFDSRDTKNGLPPEVAGSWLDSDATDIATDTDFISSDCDWTTKVGEGRHNCIPGQRKHSMRVNGGSWHFIMRRRAPINFDYGENELFINGKVNWFHPKAFDVIDVVAYKETEKPYNPPKIGASPSFGSTKQHAVCWFDNVDIVRTDPEKYLRSLKDNNFKVPIPGGKWGESKQEKEKMQMVANFWDKPKTVKKTNCSNCHIFGPVMDSPVYHQQRNENATLSEDKDIPYFWASELRTGLEFVEDNETICSECHKVIHKGENAESLIKSATSAAGDGNSNLRSGFASDVDLITLGLENNGRIPKPPAGTSSRYTHGMPIQKNNAVLFKDYQTTYGEDINTLKNCVKSGNSTSSSDCDWPRMISRSPYYFGDHEKARTIEDPYKQQIHGPAPATDTKVTLRDCDNRNNCIADVYWRDFAQNRYGAASSWRLHLVRLVPPPEPNSDPIDPPVINTEYCPSNNLPFEKNYLTKWIHEYRSSFTLDCDEKVEVRACGVFGDTLENPLNNTPEKLTGHSIERGVLFNVQAKPCKKRASASCSTRSKGRKSIRCDNEE